MLSLPLEAGRKLGGCVSDTDKRWGEGRTGDGWRRQSVDDLAAGWKLGLERKGGILSQ